MATCKRFKDAQFLDPSIKILHFSKFGSVLAGSSAECAFRGGQLRLNSDNCEHSHNTADIPICSYSVSPLSWNNSLGWKFVQSLVCLLESNLERQLLSKKDGKITLCTRNGINKSFAR